MSVLECHLTSYSVRVSAEAGQSVGVRQPRRAVIDAAWRAIGPGVECLSGDDGAPLTRTVKRIIDPLVLRLRVNTRYSAPVVTAEVAAEMHGAILEQGRRCGTPPRGSTFSSVSAADCASPRATLRSCTSRSATSSRSPRGPPTPPRLNACCATCTLSATVRPSTC